MRKLIVACLLLAAATPAAPEQAAPAIVPVDLTSFDFSPSRIHLRAGVPVVLRLRNPGRGGHNFSAPQFFAAARVEPAAAGQIRRGSVEVPSRGSVDIALIPAAGRYRLRCTHMFHTAFGMRGEIVVE